MPKFIKINSKLRNMQPTKLIFIVIYSIAIVYGIINSYFGYTLTDGSVGELFIGLILVGIFIYGLLAIIFTDSNRLFPYLLILFRVGLLVGVYFAVTLGLLAYYDSNENAKWLAYSGAGVLLLSLGIYWTVRWKKQFHFL